MTSDIRVLMIEDNEDDYILTKEIMAEVAGGNYRLDWVERFDSALAALMANRHDLALVDYNLGDRDGIELIRRAISAGSRVPMIVLTGMHDRSLDLSAMQSGAVDYLVKGEMSPAALERAIRHAMAREKLLRLEKEAKEKLRRSNERLASLYRTAHQFVDNISHEFRTPLTVIREFTSIILDGLAGGVTEEQVEYLNVVLDRVDDLRLMVDDMLDISRMEAGLFGVCRQRLEVESIIGRIEKALQRKIVTSGACLEVAVEPDLPTVYCDAENIARVIVNLVVNACKFSGESGRVELRARHVPERSEVSISVTDDGPGIAPEHLEVIFERFRQVGGNLKASEKGFGLGLSIAKELVHINLGEIEVESRPGAGATFRFSVPVFNAGVIVTRFVDKMLRHREPASSLSLIVARPALPHAPATNGDVGRFLQRQMRRCELLLPSSDGGWLICATAEGSDLERMIARFRAAHADANLNRPDVTLPALEYEVVGTWPAIPDCDELVAAFVSRCAGTAGAQGAAMPAAAVA